MKSIPLSKGAWASVDDSDFESVSKSKWCLSSHGYAVRHVPGSGKNGKIQYLHRFLLPEAIEVDHIDGDKLNNRRNNLRGVTHGDNLRAFQTKRKGVSSKYRGVSWESRRQVWEGHIRFNGKKKFLGYFDIEANAARAYDSAAIEFYGEFAQPNFKTV